MCQVAPDAKGADRPGARQPSPAWASTCGEPTEKRSPHTPHPHWALASPNGTAGWSKGSDAGRLWCQGESRQHQGRLAPGRELGESCDHPELPQGRGRGGSGSTQVSRWRVSFPMEPSCPARSRRRLVSTCVSLPPAHQPALLCSLLEHPGPLSGVLAAPASAPCPGVCTSMATYPKSPP